MGVDWKSPVEMARDLYAAKYLCLLFLGAIAVDFAHSLRFDYELIQNRKRGSKVRWPQACYLFVKLAYFPYWVLTFITGDPSWKIDCHATIFASEVLMGVVTCLCSALLAFRTLCVWEQHCGRPFKITLLLLWLGLLSTWIAGSFDVTGTWIEGIGQPWVKNKGACWFDPIPFRYAYKFVATVAFDALVLALTVAGVLKAHGRSRIGTLLLEQGIIYFVVTVVFNVMLIAFAWADLNPVMAVILSVPTQSISVMAATRLYVQLFEKNGNGQRSARKSHSPASLPTTSAPSSALSNRSKSFFSSRNARDTTHTGTGGDFGIDSMFESKTILPNESEGDGEGQKRPARAVLVRTNQVNEGEDDLEKQEGSEGDRSEVAHFTLLNMQQGKAPILLQDCDRTGEPEFQTSVHIEETRETSSEPLPPHLKGSHFLSRQRLHDLGEEVSEETANPHRAYPHLSHSNRNSTQEEGKK